MGYLYKPRRCQIWWMKYYVNGRPIRQSTGTTKEPVARRTLKEHEGRVATGQPANPRVDHIRYDEVAADLYRHYAATGERKLWEVQDRLNHLTPFFTGRRIAAIRQADVTVYILRRQGHGAANGTINRELGVLSRMLTLAYDGSKLVRLPKIARVKEADPRQGFFEAGDYQRVRRLLPEDYQVMLTIAYTFGWRLQSEILTLERRHLDLEAGTLRLDPGMTKNDDGRIVYLTPELLTLLAQQLKRVDRLGKEMQRVIHWLFPHLEGRHKGERIRNFQRRWKTACKKAGVPWMLRHDFRRTAVRNLVNVGVPERVAMNVTGHRTRAVFDRYHIVSPGDLQEATRKLSTGIKMGITSQSETIRG